MSDICKFLDIKSSVNLIFLNKKTLSILDSQKYWKTIYVLFFPWGMFPQDDINWKKLFQSAYLNPKNLSGVEELTVVIEQMKYK